MRGEGRVQGPKRTSNRIFDPDLGQKVCKWERRRQEGTGEDWKGTGEGIVFIFSHVHTGKAVSLQPPKGTSCKVLTNSSSA